MKKHSNKCYLCLIVPYCLSVVWVVITVLSGDAMMLPMELEARFATRLVQQYVNPPIKEVGIQKTQNYGSYYPKISFSYFWEGV